MPETLDVEANQLSMGPSNLLVQLLDSESCTEAKLIDVLKELSRRIELMEKKQAWSNTYKGVNERLLKKNCGTKGHSEDIEFKNRPFNHR